MSPQDAYELVTAGLRRHTAAAWVRWEDLPPEARWRWEDHYEAVLKNAGVLP